MASQCRGAAIEVGNSSNIGFPWTADRAYLRARCHFHLSALDRRLHWAKVSFRFADAVVAGLLGFRNQSSSPFASRAMVDQSCCVLLANDVFVRVRDDEFTVLLARNINRVDPGSDGLNE